MNAVAQEVSTSTFVDNGDGTITDTRTGLMWSKNDIVDDDLTHEQAEKACAEATLAGHTDWRLPAVEELFALADRTRYSPAIDTAFFPSCKSEWYWTATPYAASPSDYAWIVYFSSGSSGSGGRVSDSRVRAVRVASGQ